MSSPRDLKFGPLVPLIRSYQRILLEGFLPDWQEPGITRLFDLVCFVFGYWRFIRTRKAFLYVLQQVVTIYFVSPLRANEAQ